MGTEYRTVRLECRRRMEKAGGSSEEVREVEKYEWRMWMRGWTRTGGSQREDGKRDTPELQRKH